ALWAWSWGARFASGLLRGIGQAIGNAVFGWLPREAVEGLSFLCAVPAIFANLSGFALIPLAFGSHSSAAGSDRDGQNRPTGGHGASSHSGWLSNSPAA